MAQYIIANLNHNFIAVGSLGPSVYRLRSSNKADRVDILTADAMRGYFWESSGCEKCR